MNHRLRESNVAWIGSVPDTWNIVPANGLFTERKQRNEPEDVHLTPSQKYGVLPQAEYMQITGSKVVLNLTGADNMRHVEPGDFISHLRSFQGGLEYSEIQGKVSAAYTVITRRTEISGAYYKYLFKSAQYVQALQTTTDQLRDGQSIRMSQFKQIPLPQPPLDEQQAIAEYLDRETAQIDAFIAKNAELIALLTERRTGVIARVVSRGLDPDASVVPAGLSWVETVAESYEVTNIRRHAFMRTGHTPSRQKPEYWVDCTIPWFTLADVWQLRQGNRELGSTHDKISQLGLQNSAAELLPSGTVVLSRTASVGFPGVMPVEMATSQDFWNWVPKSTLDSNYLWYQFLAMKPEFERLMVGSTHRTIYQADAAALRIIVPPLEDQKRIVAHLDAEAARWDKAIKTAHRAIELAKERRAALISAAVTGKIDVSKEASAV